MADSCRFCRIATGDPDEHVVHIGDGTMAFLDAEPVHPGHTLVIPRDHVRGLTDMDGASVRSLYAVVRRVAVAIERAVEPAGINAIQSSGAAAGQDVHHAHVHVIPRYAGDSFGFDPPRDRYREGEAEELTTALRNHFPD